MPTIPRHHAQVTEALHICVSSHAGQTDKSGAPYFFHPIEVALRCSRAGWETQAVALLHDVFEDVITDREAVPYLMGYGFTEGIADAVDRITHRPNEPRLDYYGRVMGNRLSHYVKVADCHHNTDPDRLELLDEETRERFVKVKYPEAFRVLDPDGAIQRYLGLDIRTFD